ncbi:MAG: pyruvate kinase [Mollicutes bacterium]|nr:pyruvate kinase [Mollicutes bacterium]
MNKIKIIATIGPSSADKKVLKELMLNGMDVVRLNLSHADYKFCMEIIDKVRELNKELGTNVAIMLDTVGPEIRTGRFVNGKAKLTAGEMVKIVKEEILGDKNAFSISIPEAIDGVKHNTIIKLDDGKIELSVVEKTEDYLLCKILNDGIISDFKSVNFEYLKMNIPFISKKDREDIKFAHMMNVDFLALSFVSSSEDILEVNDLLIELENDHIGIIAKIENEKAIEGIDEIIKVSDGIMIARGDLGVEIPVERIPGVQKAIIKKCHLNGKISIVATELLSSMEKTPRPTRAEVSDIANAVLDGVDAVMLSGETTIGEYPVLTLQTMEKIIKSAEGNVDYLDLLDRAIRSEKEDITGLIAHSVADCAYRLKAKAIVVPTMSGYTARKMSRFRPSCPIIALSPNPETVKSLTLNFGVLAYQVDELNSFDKIIKIAKAKAVEILDLNQNDKIIITGGYPLKEVKHTNFMKIEEL